MSPLAEPTARTRPGDDLLHECDAPVADAETQTAGNARLVGVDAARGLALLGMFAVHTIEAATPSGDLTTTWALSSGKSSALFAVLGGVGIAFMTGRTTPPRGAGWARAACIPLVRGVLIATIGLLLGCVVAVDDADVILPYLGVMFALSALLLPLRARTLIAVGLGWAVLAPLLGHLLRSSAPPVIADNLTLGHLVGDPGGTAATLLLTGFFPALTWMAYICLGIGVGRSDLTTRRVVAWLVAGGAALAIFASLVGQALVALGLRDRLAADVQEHMTLEAFTEYLVWGGDGTLPTDSAWWLGVNAPHTGTPVDLLHTSGISLCVIGLFLALSVAMGPMLHILAKPGSMTLTLYSAHLLLLAPLRDLPDTVHFLLQAVLLVGFALAWSSRFRRGPLEWAVAEITRRVTPKRRLDPKYVGNHRNSTDSRVPRAERPESSRTWAP